MIKCIKIKEIFIINKIKMNNNFKIRVNNFKIKLKN